MPLAPGDSFEILSFTEEDLFTGVPMAIDFNSTLLDKDKSFITNTYETGFLLVVVEGTGSNERDSENPNERKARTIVSNTENTITVSPPFEFIPDDTTKYEIRKVVLGSQRISTYLTPFKISIKNTSNNQEVIFDGVEPLDAIEIDMSTRRITSLRTDNIYEK